MFADKISEAIAHFIGLFETTLEEARLRKAYEEFKAQQALETELADIPNQSVNVKVGYDFEGFDPGIPYLPLEPQLVSIEHLSYFHFQPPEVPDTIQPSIVNPGALHSEPFSAATNSSTSSSTGSSQIVKLNVDPPGSVAVYINQELYMADDDYVGVGGHQLVFNAPVVGSADLMALVEAAKALSPLGDAATPGSSEEIASFITETMIALNGFSDTGHGNAKVFIAKGDTIEGPFVNGELVEEIPNLDDILPPEEPLSSETSSAKTPVEHGGRHGDEIGPDKTNLAQSSETLGEGEIAIKASVEVETGANTLVNSVSLTNNWTGGQTFAVAGDHVKLNAIVQVNAWCDDDNITSAINGWGLAESAPTQAFNIAMFKHVDPAGEDSPVVAGDFPTTWGVTRIDGDLLIMNWIEQYSFMTDNDICILSSSGVTTTVTAGENTAVNEISLYELSYFYDLVIVGGSVYDANIIFQTNVLLDNDLIGAVAGFETTGEGSVSAQGNLLWNQAGIVNYSRPDQFSDLPQHYNSAIEKLRNGDDSLSADILSDPAFAGLTGLRVLYVSGDFINLQYIKQMNVLGDSDQVALAMNAVQAHPEADWTLSTDANSLINLASIVDVDASTKTYVGGEVYSDEILIQAELISAEPDLGSQNPDVLVNEAVAFLSDDVMSPNEVEQQVAASAPNGLDTAYADPMHNMLA
jgi:hypothetical protein